MMMISLNSTVYPDEIFFQIFNKLIDLKTLNFCKLVCKRFYSIVNQVDTISFTAPSDFVWNTCIAGKCESLLVAVNSMNKLRFVKCLLIVLSSSCLGVDVDNGCLFKWKIKFGNKLDYFVYLSPDSIIDILHVNNGQEVEVEDEEDIELRVDKKIDNAITECRKDASVRFMMFCECVSSFPLMETVSITDSDKRGKISVSGGKINELRKWLHSPSQTIDQMMIRSTHGPHRISGCYFPLLELPVSGHVMKRVTLVLAERADLTDDERNRFINIDDEEDYIEDKEEAAFSEALMEILENRRDEMETIAVL